MSNHISLARDNLETFDLYSSNKGIGKHDPVISDFFFVVDNNVSTCNSRPATNNHGMLNSTREL